MIPNLISDGISVSARQTFASDRDGTILKSAYVDAVFNHSISGGKTRPARPIRREIRRKHCSMRPVCRASSKASMAPADLVDLAD
jgi:hypothetical protein